MHSKIIFSLAIIFSQASWIRIGYGATIQQTENAECNLSPELLAEIRSYQVVVDKIAAAAINGSFAGNTWRR